MDAYGLFSVDRCRIETRKSPTTVAEASSASEGTHSLHVIRAHHQVQSLISLWIFVKPVRVQFPVNYS